MKMKYILSMVLASALFSTVHAAYEFYGKHFVASYKECDVQALTDTTKLVEVLEKAVIASGATILHSDTRLFDGGGCTAVFVLSESHASIHTYPEHKAVFIDLFTCGTHCTYERFAQILEEYLKPNTIEKQVLIRN